MPEPIRTVTYSAKLTTLGDGRVRVVILHQGRDVAEAIFDGLQQVMDLADQAAGRGRGGSVDEKIGITESVVCVMNPERKS